MSDPRKPGHVRVGSEDSLEPIWMVGIPIDFNVQSIRILVTASETNVMRKKSLIEHFRIHRILLSLFLKTP
jgi:hypothetical protein